MSTATEEGHTSIQQDGGYEGWVWNPTQAFDAAFKASLTENEISQQRLLKF